MSLTKRNKIIFVVLALAVCAVWFGFIRYRQHVRCDSLNAAFQQHVEKLKRDAHDQLRIGVSKDEVVRFFEGHQIQMMFGSGEASGSFLTVACAPFGCGDSARVVVSVAVDSRGTVTREAQVLGTYPDCL